MLLIQSLVLSRNMSFHGCMGSGIIRIKIQILHLSHIDDVVLALSITMLNELVSVIAPVSAAAAVCNVCCK